VLVLVCVGAIFGYRSFAIRRMRKDYEHEVKESEVVDADIIHVPGGHTPPRTSSRVADEKQMKPEDRTRPLDRGEGTSDSRYSYIDDELSLRDGDDDKL